MAPLPIASGLPALGLDANGFDPWITSRSYSMLVPMCQVGLAVVLTMLLVVDPLLFQAGVWGGDRQHHALVVWHACAALHFLGFSLLADPAREHRGRSRVLAAFFTLSAGLFCWFGLISWMLSGDLSTYAMFLLTMVCVFAFPGHLRAVINVASAILLVALVYCVDPSHTFHTSGAALNLLALHVVTLLIDRFLMRLNWTLYREKCKTEFERARADRVLYNALPVSIADELKCNNVVKAESYVRMAVLFVDIVGFTRFSATHTPDTVVQILNDIFSEFDRIVDHYDAEKIKTIGDAYMVVGKGSLSDIARLALDMLGSMHSYRQRSGFGLAVRCGIHVGPTVAGVIGLKRFLYDVWGDAVNVASRMESLGEAGRVHVSEDVYQELAGSFAFECRGTMDIKGKGLMRTYFLLPPATDPHRACRSPSSPRQAAAPSVADGTDPETQPHRNTARPFDWPEHRAEHLGHHRRNDNERQRADRMEQGQVVGPYGLPPGVNSCQSLHQATDKPYREQHGAREPRAAGIDN